MADSIFKEKKFLKLVHETKQKNCESPNRPRVPGPVISPSRLTNENAPLIMPKPKPDTYYFQIKSSFNSLKNKQDLTNTTI